MSIFDNFWNFCKKWKFCFFASWTIFAQKLNFQKTKISLNFACLLFSAWNFVQRWFLYSILIVFEKFNKIAKNEKLQKLKIFENLKIFHCERSASLPGGNQVDALPPVLCQLKQCKLLCYALIVTLFKF